MKFHFSPAHSATYLATLVALIATSAVPAYAAAIASAPEVRSEVRTVIIDSDTVVENAYGTADVVIAQSGPGSNKREIKMSTTGRDFNLADMPGMPDVDVIVSNALSEAFSGAGMMSVAKNIKNAPYSAEVISEKVQTLSDGNQITHKNSTMAFRDSAGRTRQETRNNKGEVNSINIHDAVEGTRYVISPSRKSATKIGVDKDLRRRVDEIREKAKAMTKDGTAHIIERSNPGEEIVVKVIELPASEGKQGVREDVRVNVTRLSGEPKLSISDSGAFSYTAKNAERRGMALSELSPLKSLGNLFMDSKWSGKSTTTQLGTRDFDGVRAEGKSVSYTIPAGEIGNKNPIIVTNETWTSPDLQVVVYSKHSDPRVGDSIYRLANVKRTEQPATLFMVPDGYSVKETPGMSWSSKTK